jgi:anaerobic selenocysteine-containing dehydrogenase
LTRSINFRASPTIILQGTFKYTRAPCFSGNELRNVAQWQKALGLAERPLGLGKSGWILSDDLYRAVIEAQPYRVRALVGFGLNLLLSHADAARGAEALCGLAFHVQSDLYLTPTAAYADIVLPVASAWEREGLRVGFDLDQDACERVQFRPAVVAPRGEARAASTSSLIWRFVSASVSISGTAVSRRRSIIA